MVAEVGDTPDLDKIYRLTYDGSVGDEHGYVAMGGQAEYITGLLRDSYVEGAPLAQALRLAVDSLTMGVDGQRGELTAAQLEVAVLDRTRPRRAFRRYVGAQLEASCVAATESASSAADVDVDATEGASCERTIANADRPVGPNRVGRSRD